MSSEYKGEKYYDVYDGINIMYSNVCNDEFNRKRVYLRLFFFCFYFAKNTHILIEKEVFNMSRADKKIYKDIIKHYVKRYEETHNTGYLDEALKLKNWMKER